MQVAYKVAETRSELEQIIALQKANHFENLDAEEKQKEGFVTVQHSLVEIQQLNDIEKHVIAVAHGKVVGYVLAMTPKSKNDIALLVPMFAIFDSILYKGKPLSDYRYLVVGQVCIDKEFRGQGLFSNAYEFYKKLYREKYDFVLTEINIKNERSMGAHYKIGFNTIHQYQEPNGVQWAIVLWDWR